ncbi:hypothetical protein AZE42_00928 [Rhizopogon vesiculosus]|uniref:Cyclin N-terminal domain-containing protein n=1 Tax=Rhizopogon vesiculosus TaxID=180088 RepID=A0A1J8Q138_9AGAM|nr:hypothetical protein AZE42_00928 [Rhizopogon vesiculosus]
MPVPVPRASQPPVHKAHKHSKTEDASKSHSSVFNNLKYTLPVSPTGPPPSFGSRDQWINSLPAWRRTKVRRILEDDTHFNSDEQRDLGYHYGLTRAADAQVIKGSNAEAYLPPINAFPKNYGVNPSSKRGDVDQPMYREQMRPTYAPFWGVAGRDCPDDSSPQGYVWPPVDHAFAPVLEDDSEDMINGDLSSSPIGPMTPFAEYVDRAVAATDVTTLCGIPLQREDIQGLCHGLQCYDVVDYQYADSIKQEAVPPVSDSAPSASMKYKKFAEPMADWIVSYVWKVCKNAITLPAAVSKYSSSISSQPAPTAPMHLSASVHSLLMSTLLQPSAVLLAMWYIARLPVYFAAVPLGVEQVKERRFRAELLDTTGGIDEKTLEANATFRLIVLGCMLANKWLDDHTFSNKTWHTICKLPVHSLNKLESLALDIFSHNLTISPAMWDQWLGHTLSYHISLSPPSYSQPISRPSSNPQSFVRRIIEEIRGAPRMHPSSRPVFLSFDQRSKGKLSGGVTCDEASGEGYDIDLDEDGPLRQEYLPKRRVSSGSSTSQCATSRVEGVQKELREPKASPNESTLPPPSKWSPAADEPIRRVGDRPALYMPVQPLYANSVSGVCWAPAMTYVAVKPRPDYSSASKPIPSNDSFYSQAVNPQLHPQPCCNADAIPPSNPGFWYPQFGFHYPPDGDVRMSFDGTGHTSQPMGNWPSVEPYGFTPAPRVLFGPHPPINYPASWIRA